jgi:hypothetical protein
MITLEKETYFVSVPRIMQSQIQRLLTVISNAQIRWRSAAGSSFILCGRWPGIPLEFNGCRYWKTTCLGQLAGLPMGVSGIFVLEFLYWHFYMDIFWTHGFHRREVCEQMQAPK